MFNGSRSGNHINQESCWWALSCWSSTLLSCYRNDNDQHLYDTNMPEIGRWEIHTGKCPSPRSLSRMKMPTDSMKTKPSLITVKFDSSGDPSVAPLETCFGVC